MPGRRYSNGLHQALEAKENVEVRRESKTLATITLQNYFRLYSKLAGMTGTALTEARNSAKFTDSTASPSPDESRSRAPRPPRFGVQKRGGEIRRDRREN